MGCVSDTPEDFALTLSRARRAARLTQGQLARRCGLSATFIGAIERRDKVPSDSAKARINAALIAALDEPYRYDEARSE